MKYTAFVLAGAALFFSGYFARGYQDGNIFSAKEDVAHSAVAAEGEKAGFTPVQQSGNAAESTEKKQCADVQAMQQAGQTAASTLGAAGAEGELISKRETETPEQKLAASLRAAGFPEEDIKNMTAPATKEPAEQSAQTEDFYEKSDEERREELAASLREAGFPEEDIENMTANPDKRNNMSDEEIAKNEQMKSDLAASLREAGFPEEDIENMTN